MKRDLAGCLAKAGHEVIDLGTHTSAPVDYPDISEAVAQAVRNGQADRGIVVCGSGAGAAIAACKFPGIAAVCHDTTREAGRRTRDMNVAWARGGGPALARSLAGILAAAFRATSGVRRLAKIGASSRYARQ